MKTYKQFKAALRATERSLDDQIWSFRAPTQYCEFSRWFVKRGEEYVSLYDIPSPDDGNRPLDLFNVVSRLVNAGDRLYVEDYDSSKIRPAKEGEVARLLRAETRLNKTNAKRYWLETIVDECGLEDGELPKWAQASFEEAARELAALGYSVD